MSPTRLSPRRAFLLAFGAAVVLLMLFFVSPRQFFHSYLLGFVLWWTVLPGSVAILLLHDLTGGEWGENVRPLLRPLARTIPLLALLFVPLALGLGANYAWAAEPGAASTAKAAYLNAPFFLARAAFYFVVWMVLARWSATRAAAEDRPAKRSALGLILYVLTVTFASVDWLMSLDPEFYSTGFGLRIVMSQATGALAVGLVLLGTRSRPTSKALLDLGNLLLAFVMLWAYIAFTQFLIVWSGDLPPETVWYRARFAGGFQWLGLALVVFHFAVPFLILLLRVVKKNVRALVYLGLGILAMRWLDSIWLVSPTFQTGFGLHLADVLVPLGLGVLWLAVFLRELRKEELVDA